MKSILLLLLLSLNLSDAKIHLSDLIPLCDVDDPNLNDCVVNSANLLIPVLAKGIKDFGFPPLDPLRVPKMDMDQSDQPISLKMKLTDSVHTGLSTMKFYSASVDPKNNEWILNATLPQYIVKGNYKASGRIILLPIVGNGTANFNYTNTGVDFVLNGTRLTEKGEELFNLTSLNVYFTFDGSSISFTNLFGGNRQLSM